jgi:hypothetical protein
VSGWSLPVLTRALAYALALATCLGATHVVLSRRQAGFSHLAFVVSGAVASLVAGLVLAGDALVGALLRNPVLGLIHAVGLALGLVAVGTVLSVAWLVAVKGGAFAVTRWRQRQRR